MVTKKELQVYYRKIKKHLVCSKSSKQGCMDDFSAQLEEYLHEAPQTTIKEIHTIFGTPKTVADNYQEQLIREEVKKYKTRMRWTRIISSIVILTMLFTLYLIFINSREHEIIISEPELVTNFPISEIY